jgi:hypothetical protein
MCGSHIERFPVQVYGRHAKDCRVPVLNPIARRPIAQRTHLLHCMHRVHCAATPTPATPDKVDNAARWLGGIVAALWRHGGMAALPGGIVAAWRHGLAALLAALAALWHKGNALVGFWWHCWRHCWRHWRHCGGIVNLAPEHAAGDASPPSAPPHMHRFDLFIFEVCRWKVQYGHVVIGAFRNLSRTQCMVGICIWASSNPDSKTQISGLSATGCRIP